MSVVAPAGTSPFRPSLNSWVVLALGAAIIAFIFRDAIAVMMHTWSTREEYSYGPIVPLLAAFLVWQRKDALDQASPAGRWAGVALVAFGIAMHFVGHVATLFVVQQYAMLVVVYGVVLAATGWNVFRKLSGALLILAFMIPLPEFLLFNLSSQLQLVSSRIGVWLIRLFGISVNLEGNVIDLGSYKLQVAEACNGLRYLFPLLTIGFIMALFYRAEWWKRALVFLSSIPITVLMNSFRIGLIGITVEHWGTVMAEGFLHEFQGWLIFMISAAIMLLEIVLLSRVGRVRRPWRELFRIEVPAVARRRSREPGQPVPSSLIAATLVAGIYVFVLSTVPERAEAVPSRVPFTEFPERLGDWAGRSQSIEPVYLKTLKLDDYFIADYASAGQPGVNLYAAWYSSQRAGRSTHSPRGCLPGGGWRIEQLDQVTLADTTGPDGPIRANRAVISLGDRKQVVYYWFQQRGRVITNEYLVKWYLFWDAVTRNRTDGSLVRITSPVVPGESIEATERRMLAFAALATPRLTASFIPG